MASPQVIHLVSNDLEHPENTAAKFKVSYNVPFDLKGKKIALIDATFTKSQENVKEEAITFEFLNRQRTDISQKFTFTPALKPWDSSLTNMKDFFKRFNQSFKMNDGVKLGKITYTYFEERKQLRITVYNQSAAEARVAVNRNKWTLLNAPSNASEDRADFKIAPQSQLKIKFDVSDLDLSMMNSEAAYDTLMRRRGRAIRINMTHLKPMFLPPPQPKSFRPGPNYFTSIEELIDTINKKPGFSELATLSLRHGKVVLKTHVKNCRIYLGGLEHHFGFDGNVILVDEDDVEAVAGRPPNLYSGTHHFYIYCSLVKNVMVNNHLVPLLGTLDATQGKYGEQVMHPVVHPLYVDAEEGPHQVVEVEVADDVGNRKGLLMSRTKLTLSVVDK